MSGTQLNCNDNDRGIAKCLNLNDVQTITIHFSTVSPLKSLSNHFGLNYAFCAQAKKNCLYAPSVAMALQ